MAKTRTHAIRALDEQGIPYQLAVHAHRAMNVEEAAAERGVPIQQIVKTLLVRRPDQHYILVLVRGDQRLSLKKLARLAGEKSLEMAPPEDVPRITGYQVGAVAPLGLRRRDLPMYVDHHILDETTVSISAGRHDAGLVLAVDHLLRAVGGQVVDITE
jgi:Cys-tRNA(Pro)/Cys-tRNA(Cys) deacylase